MCWAVGCLHIVSRSALHRGTFRRCSSIESILLQYRQGACCHAEYKGSSTLARPFPCTSSSTICAHEHLSRGGVDHQHALLLLRWSHGQRHAPSTCLSLPLAVYAHVPFQMQAPQMQTLGNGDHFDSWNGNFTTTLLDRTCAGSWQLLHALPLGIEGDSS